MEISCRSDRKQQPFTVQLENTATFDALLTKVLPEIDLTDECKPAISVKMGFPPKPVPMELEALLSDSGFGARTKIIIEVNDEMLQTIMKETTQPDVNTQLKEEQSAFDDGPGINQNKALPNSQVMHNASMEEEKVGVQADKPQVSHQPSLGQNHDDGMDENERLIAQLMAEEANAMDAQNLADDLNKPGDTQQQPGLGGGDHADDGIRAPDQQRVQTLVGGPSDDFDDFRDPYDQQPFRRPPLRGGGIGGAFVNAAQSVATGMNNVLGPPGQANQPQPMNSGFPSAQPGGDNFGDVDAELQAALASSLDQQQQVVSKIEQRESSDEALARAMAESMQSVGQAQPQPQPTAVINPPAQQQPQPGNDLAATEEEMIRRAIEESKNAQ